MANPFDIIFSPIIGTKTILVAGTEIFVGLTPLDSRKSITIFNNSDYPIQLSNDPSFIYGQGIPLFQGQFIKLTLNPDRYDAWYAKTETTPTDVTIVEVR